MNDAIYYIASKLNKKWVKGFKQLTNNPVALGRYEYINTVLPNIENYYITDKADGIRCFLHITTEFARYITANSVKYITGALPVGASKGVLGATPGAEYIFDCELVNDVVYIFDVVVFNSTPVSSKIFQERYKLLVEFEKSLTSGEFDEELKKLVYVKKFYKLDVANYEMRLIQLYKYNVKNTPYEVDGIIFVESTADYNNTLNLKWKPANELTIDFLALKCAPGKYVLVNGITLQNAERFGITPNKKFRGLIESLDNDKNPNFGKYIPVPFYNSVIPNIYIVDNVPKMEEEIDMRVIELSFKDGDWHFHRIRKDRDIELKSRAYYGNDYKVAETTLRSIMNPLNFKDLLLPMQLLQNSYFTKQDDDYRAIKRFNNDVKRELISKYKRDTVMDLASGRGGDLGKYISAGVKNLIMLEIDNDAIDELLICKYNILPKSTHTCNMAIIQMDLNVAYKKNIKTIEQNFVGADAFVDNIPVYNQNSIPVIFCHFAMHYMLKDESSVNNIAAFISYYLQKSGMFIMTIFDSGRVQYLLKDGEWRPNDKYMIRYKAGANVNIADSNG